MKRVFINPLYLLSALLFLTASAGAQQGPPANVNVALIKTTTISPTSWVSGTVVAHNNSKIAAEISGRLISLVELGAKVKKHQIIAQIDDRRLKLQRIEEQANVENAQAQLTFEQSEVRRKKALINKKLVSQTELDETLSKKSIAQGNLSAAKARLAQIEQNIAYTQLKAPFDGIIAQRQSNEGEYVDSGNAIVRIVETANLEASIFAPLTAYQYLKQNLAQDKALSIRSPLGAGSAKIKTLIPVADSRSHLMEVRLDMTAFDWPIGLNITAAVAIGESKEVLAIPRDALVLRRNGTTVFRIDEKNIAQQVDVLVGMGEGDLVEITGNINEGDRIVIRGAERLRVGQTVNVKTNNQSLISGNNSSGDNSSSNNKLAAGNKK
jgi:RND family efflux transporter MFP subunit